MPMTDPLPLPALGLREVHDDTVVPTPRKWPVDVVRGGAVSASGEVLADTLLYRNFSQVVFAPQDVPAPEEVIDAPHLYGGFCIDHFGHFLLEGLARAWATQSHPDMPLVWATPGAASGWQQTVCDLMGFGDRMRFVDKPTRFKTLLIPEPGYRIRDRFHPHHRAFLAQSDPEPFPHKKVWLSRCGLLPGSQIGREAELEDALRTAGWHVARPETLPLDEQLGLYAGAQVIGGAEGSAMHLPVLLRQMRGALIVVRRFDNENFSTIAKACALRQHDVVGAIDHAPTAGGPTFVLHSPQVTAGILEDIAQTEISGAGPVAGDFWGLTHYQSNRPRFAPQMPRPGTGPTPNLARRVKRRLFG